MTLVAVVLIFSVLSGIQTELIDDNDQSTSFFNFVKDTKVIKFPTPENIQEFIRYLLSLESKKSPIEQVCEYEENEKIRINEWVATDEQFPFVAELVMKYKSEMRGRCIGSLIRTNWILTATHCVHDSSDEITDIAVLMNIGQNLTNRQKTTVLDAHYIETSAFAPQIALIAVAKPFKVNKFVNVVKISNDFGYNPETVFKVVGLESTQDDQPSREILDYLNFKINNPLKCLADTGLNGLIEFCSRDPNHRAAWIYPGLYGGPALTFNQYDRAILIGVNTYDYGECDPKKWLITLKLIPFLPWINHYTGALDLSGSISMYPDAKLPR